ncbi:MAG: lytic transglycosylase domain-containing protein [Deltaproteobacteria bacterium]|nr:lytic transglycosylase domain-containing protein [Deltaproteobacteria bacterium]MBI4223884.1 lytic transglycosylase domain-containing protein [Deltaproteobacteria bacterium]
MDKRVGITKLGALFPKAVEKHKEVQKRDRSFSETLKSQGKGDAKALPRFPAEKARAKTITTAQAQRLARYAPLIKESAAKHQVPVELICGVILQESNANPRTVSHAGAKGLMQLIPDTARRFGVRNSFDPAQNIEGGTRYLRFLLDRYDGNVELTLAAYNAGEKNVEKHGLRIPPFRETQNYVPNVLGYARTMIEMLRVQPPATPPSTLAMRGKMA